MLLPSPDRVLLDVRSPGEYAEGHIVGARSLPLFSDEERAEVGTAYKQEGPAPAFLLGLERSGPKLRAYVERALELAPGRRVTVHCWRGGQRSASMGWLLERAGFDVAILPGGYKAYRTEARAWLGSFPHHLRLLCGPTGSGKTAVLHALRAQGAAILDLEGMARHRGSSFGAIGQEPQP
ncbi:MAG: rhodanese-like domain-containing protein, partial [Saprospiraceae bacterium]